VIHNAAFDVAFLNMELARAARPRLDCPVVDTLALAQRVHPGRLNSLDALSRRYKIKIARPPRSALLDSRILAAVYSELLGGSQMALPFAVLGAGGDRSVDTVALRLPWQRELITPEESAAHERFIAEMESPIWNSYMEPRRDAA